MGVTLILSISLVLLGGLLGGLWVLHSVIRRRRQVTLLLERVRELEEQMTGSPEDSASDTMPGVSEHRVEESALSRDALAGWTSHVGRLLSELAVPSDPAEQAIICIYRRLGDVMRPSDLAAQLNVSLRTLERGLARSLDCSPSDLILTVKMREARRMLEAGHFNVGDVAHRLAFADAAHFSRRYRLFYRCPPSEHLPAGDAKVEDCCGEGP